MGHQLDTVSLRASLQSISKSCKRVDDGPEIDALSKSEWVKTPDVHLAFIQPSRSMQNAYIERCNRGF